MMTQRTRTSTLPSALVLRSLCADAGEVPFEKLEQAGFTRGQVADYLQRCTARSARARGEQGRCETAA
jgi:hypothetical protein